MWVNSCLNVIEIYAFRNNGEKDKAQILAVVLAGILSLFVLK